MNCIPIFVHCVMSITHVERKTSKLVCIHCTLLTDNITFHLPYVSTEQELFQVGGSLDLLMMERSPSLTLSQVVQACQKEMKTKHIDCIFPSVCVYDFNKNKTEYAFSCQGFHGTCTFQLPENKNIVMAIVVHSLPSTESDFIETEKESSSSS